MKKNKALTAINRLRLDDYIREMFHTFGISVKARYQRGAKKRSGVFRGPTKEYGRSENK